MLCVISNILCRFLRSLESTILVNPAQKFDPEVGYVVIIYNSFKDNAKEQIDFILKRVVFKCYGDEYTHLLSS